MRHGWTLGLPGDVTVFGEVKPEPDIPNLDEAVALAERRRPGPRRRLRRRQRHGPREAGRCPARQRQTIHEVVGPEKVDGDASR